MYEYIVAVFALDKSETFFCVKPFYCTFFHECCLLVCYAHIVLLSLLMIKIFKTKVFTYRLLPNKNNSSYRIAKVNDNCKEWRNFNEDGHSFNERKRKLYE